jgi:hypothetical protein
MPTKEKRKGFGLEIRSRTGKDGVTYIFFKTTKGAYHAFKEVEAKEAARQYGAKKEGHTREMCNEIWDG